MRITLFGRSSFLRVLAVLALAGTSLTAHAQLPRVAPIGAPWSAGPGFEFAHAEKKVRRSLSGIACGPDARNQTICLFAFDEGVEARFGRIGAGALQPLPDGVTLGIEGTELDAESAATDGAFFYVSGSHAMKRKSCAANPASQHVLRFRRDAGTGLPVRPAGPGTRPEGYADSTRLMGLLAADPQLKGYVEGKHCLGTGGVDIEGLAVRDGRLFFGLRGPTDKAFAFIVSVDAEAFFAGADTRLLVTRLRVGTGRGIRDLIAVKDGILLLAGPDDDPRNTTVPWTISLWGGAGEGRDAVDPQTLAELDLRTVALRKCDKEIKPEAMAVLEETPRQYQLLLLSDGMCDGGALRFDIPR